MERKDRASIATAVKAAAAKVDRNVSRALYGRTVLWVALTACVAVGVIVSHVAHVERSLLHTAALDDAAERLRSLDHFRGAALAVPSEDGAVSSYKANPHVSPGAPPIPGTFEFALADRVMRAADRAELRIYSAYPFPSNPDGGLADDFAVEAWKQLREDPRRPFYRVEEDADGREVLRYAVAEVMRAPCASCHNDSPWSQKHDWQVGDVGGVIEVQVPHDRAAEMAGSVTMDTFMLLIAVTGFGVAALAVLIRRLKRSAAEAQRLALSTDEINCALEREVAQRTKAETALSAANERLSTNHAQLENWAADLEIAHARLREVDGLKTKFLSEVSHELRSPVAAIVSAAKIITKHHTTKPEVVARFGKTIVSEGERMTRLINDFLDLTKIESGCIDWTEGEIDPEAFVNEALVNADSLALEGGIQLVQAVEPNLPKLRADPDRLMQVLTNLVNNAMKFTPSGGSVTVRAALRGRDMLFAVDDTGPGIPADELSRVFDRFRQVRPEKYADGKKRVGTGLGLCISREIVQHYGGRIWVESEVGHGSSFCFTVPMQRESAVRADEAAPSGNGANAAQASAAANGLGAGGVSARVVLLLDDYDAAKLAARVGQAAGLDCRACKDVGDLFAAQERWSPDAYVVSAPILQGDDELLGRIRADGASKLLVYSPDHGLTAPSLLDSAELLVPSLRALVRPGASVLVVEDDEKYRGILEFELQQAGYRVSTAAEGREALARILEGGPDAVILDLIMPGMDGIAVLERLQATGGVKIPILVYTAMDDPSVALAAKDLGATEVFRKDGTGKTVYTAVAARVRRVLGQTLAPGRQQASRSRDA